MKTAARGIGKFVLLIIRVLSLALLEAVKLVVSRVVFSGAVR